MASPVGLQKKLVSVDVRVKKLTLDVKRCDKANVLALRTREASESLLEMASMIREVETLARAAGRNERDDMNNLVETYWTMMRENQTALRKAIVGAQHSIDRLHRTELFRSEERSIENEQGKSAGIRRRGKMEKESLVRHSASVTDSLLGISRAMNDQVTSSSATIEHLVDSSATIIESGQEATKMNQEIQHSSKLLTKYDRRETTDKILIFFSFLFFFACVLYVLKKRAGIPFSWLYMFI
ncbi:vesicle transport protein SEC20-like [Varroa jacobsoni]|uniref:Sec20 C-terminal domain-containing protein n=1 Tax=Varroa destructor TaxID=109461 RepID=A0A7M7M9C6_VARDE|nr:vesicle transport protein SEC20-like [Varroa destructor]XP_022659445.1 vesicle transport protein SEC20-like [Varroa destructor]XP_022659446.1 vesicle transport protein SEC20-like [Varroa destructor]XP_022659447.1 vesicle transport protein SEC20-like [Varroa destructor]XP_022659448.1 vesicle transport protein SEC20-like [Varroa destructor]XP_022659449.1 vesicle transport protein SEC20-like [Varroa destructor]XP_022659451.1 vesicle transport protein SEC20-like [Varroa destructor]XP_02269838